MCPLCDWRTRARYQTTRDSPCPQRLPTLLTLANPKLVYPALPFLPKESAGKAPSLCLLTPGTSPCGPTRHDTPLLPKRGGANCLYWRCSPDLSDPPHLSNNKTHILKQTESVCTPVGKRKRKDYASLIA